jgi:uncharacterized protein YbjT (DUF2867 family)
MSRQTAIIVGATGAIGRKLTPLIVASERYAKLIILHRKATPFANLDKVDERLFDFRSLSTLPVEEPVEDVFCCVGTTQKKAGSPKEFQHVDRDIPVGLAKWAAAHQAGTFVTVSAVGASSKLPSPYMRTKGEMEDGVSSSGVRSAYIMRPSLLRGERDDFRLAEEVGNAALAVLGPIMIGPFKKYRSVRTETVAKAMLICAKMSEPGVHIVSSDTIQELAA